QDWAREWCGANGQSQARRLRVRAVPGVGSSDLQPMSAALSIAESISLVRFAALRPRGREASAPSELTKDFRERSEQARQQVIEANPQGRPEAHGDDLCLGTP